MRYARWVIGISLLISDILSLLLAFGLSSLLRLWLLGDIDYLNKYPQIIPIFLVTFILFAWRLSLYFFTAGLPV